MIAALAEAFAVEGVRFSMQDQLVIIEVENAYGKFKLTPHGASLLSYIPAQGGELIWVSETAIYSGTKPVRGGIPICWPWFGGHPTDSSLPAHGFVRNAPWQVVAVQALATGATQVTLQFEHSEATLAMWPHPFRLELVVELAEQLTMTLTTTNLGDESMQITEALHTYFKVADAKGIAVNGLEGSLHLDKLTHAAGQTQSEPVVVNPPMDSVYLNQTADMVIEDVAAQRKIVIAKQNANSSVVWNPGLLGAEAFADMPNASWVNMLCVEAGNVLDNAVTIAAGQSHTMTMQLSEQR